MHLNHVDIPIIIAFIVALLILIAGWREQYSSRKTASREGDSGSFPSRLILNPLSHPPVKPQ